MRLRLGFGIASVASAVIGLGILFAGWIGTESEGAMAFESRGFGVLFFLPPTALATWLFGLVALLLQHRTMAAGVFTLAVIAAFYLIWYLLATLLWSLFGGCAFLAAAIIVVASLGIRFLVVPARRSLA